MNEKNFTRAFATKPEKDVCSLNAVFLSFFLVFIWFLFRVFNSPSAARDRFICIAFCVGYVCVWCVRLLFLLVLQKFDFSVFIIYYCLHAEFYR